MNSQIKRYFKYLPTYCKRLPYYDKLDLIRKIFNTFHYSRKTSIIKDLINENLDSDFKIKKIQIESIIADLHIHYPDEMRKNFEKKYLKECLVKIVEKL